MRVRHCNFTLIELVVVLVIIAITTAIAVPALRSESPARMTERVAMEFRAFCARVRFQAMESTSDKLVRFDPESGTFFMASASDGTGDDTMPETPESARLKWKLPDDFSLENDTLDFGDAEETGDEMEQTYPEIFRFFPDGGASGKRKLVLRLQNLTRTIRISHLTGETRVDTETEYRVQ